MADRFVDPDNGNDAWDGTSKTYVSGSVGPLRTIKFSTLNAWVSAGGGALRLKPGAIHYGSGRFFPGITGTTTDFSITTWDDSSENAIVLLRDEPIVLTGCYTLTSGGAPGASDKIRSLGGSILTLGVTKEMDVVGTSIATGRYVASVGTDAYGEYLQLSASVDYSAGGFTVSVFDQLVFDCRTEGLVTVRHVNAIANQRSRVRGFPFITMNSGLGDLQIEDSILYGFYGGYSVRHAKNARSHVKRSRIVALHHGLTAGDATYAYAAPNDLLVEDTFMDMSVFGASTADGIVPHDGLNGRGFTVRRSTVLCHGENTLDILGYHNFVVEDSTFLQVGGQYAIGLRGSTFVHTFPSFPQDLKPSDIGKAFGGGNSSTQYHTVSGCSATASATLSSANSFTTAGVTTGMKAFFPGCPDDLKVSAVAGDGLSVTLSAAVTVSAQDVSFHNDYFTSTGARTSVIGEVVAYDNTAKTITVRQNNGVMGDLRQATTGAYNYQIGNGTNGLFPPPSAVGVRDAVCEEADLSRRGVFRRNYVEFRPTLGVGYNAGAPFQMSLSYGQVYDNMIAGHATSGGLIYMTTGGHSVEFYHNIVAHYPNAGLPEKYSERITMPAVSNSTWKVKNNVFVCTVNQTIWSFTSYGKAGYDGWEIDYNYYYTPSANFARLYGGSYQTFAQWQASGNDTHSILGNGRDHGYNIDEVKSLSRLRLLPEGRCVGAGVHIPGLERVVPFRNPPSIGPLEPEEVAYGDHPAIIVR